MNRLKFVLILVALILMIPMCLAVCKEGQIDINSASAEDLDKIIWVGPATAEKIINGRPFENVDSLIDVSGIGEIKLADIKEQGLACVNEEIEKKNDGQIFPEEEKVQEKNQKKINIEEIKKEKPKNTESETIKLNTKDIKSKVDKKNLDKSDYAKYGFVIFCVLLGFLFMFKKRKFKKNELA